jgi:hypothetical protein
MSAREIGCNGIEWIYLARIGDQMKALVNKAMNLQVV